MTVLEEAGKRKLLKIVTKTMKKIQLIKDHKTGIESSNCEISIDEWKHLLTNGTITYEQIDVLQKFYQEQGHKSTCKNMSIKYGETPNYYNAKITTIGKYVQRELDRFHVIQNDKERFWPILMDGRIVKDKRYGSFEWIVKPELCKALKDLYHLK